MASRFENRGGVMIDIRTGNPPTAEDHAQGDAAMDAMLSTESAFELALRKRYKSQAGSMRYHTDELPPDIKKLALDYQDAVEVWRKTWMM